MAEVLIKDKSVFLSHVAVRQLANTWISVDQDLCHQMASLGHNEFKCIITTLTSAVFEFKVWTSK